MATSENRVQELEEENASLKKRLAELTQAVNDSVAGILSLVGSESQPTKKQKTEPNSVEPPKVSTQCPYCGSKEILHCRDMYLGEYTCEECNQTWHLCPRNGMGPVKCQTKTNGTWLYNLCPSCHVYC
jgi:hypothetical protein